jgi:hypothetical protein
MIKIFMGSMGEVQFIVKSQLHGPSNQLEVVEHGTCLVFDYLEMHCCLLFQGLLYLKQFNFNQLVTFCTRYAMQKDCMYHWEFKFIEYKLFFCQESEVVLLQESGQLCLRACTVPMCHTQLIWEPHKHYNF